MSRRNVEAEQAVLGGIMLAPDAYWRVSGLLTADDFAHPAHKQIWQAIRECLQPAPGGQQTPVDPVTLGEWFDARGKSGVVQGGAYLIELFTQTPSAANIVAYAEIVSKRAEAERVQAAGRRIATCDSYTEAQSVLAEVRPQQAQRVKSVKDGLSEMLEAMQLRASGPYGLSWGIPELDAIAGRLVGSRVYGIAGRAKMGKTTLSLCPQLAAVLSNRRVLNFSLEMTAGDLTTRALSFVGQFSHEVFERPGGVPDEMWPQINEAARQLVEKRWMIDDQPALTMDQIEGRSIQHHMESPLDLIVVDHIGLVKLPGRGTRNDELGGVTYGLKNLSKRINVPILALIQLNRSLETRDDKRPKMPDLRDSGNIEQDFDLICGIYRDEVYNPNSLDAGHAEIITMATRHTKGGTAFVRAHMEKMTYGPAERARRCFPPVSHGKAGGGGSGSGFAGYGAQGSQQGAVSRVGRDD
jgi:replicative DNA helicase